MKTGYSTYLMVELAKIQGIIPKELEYDLAWKKGEELIKEFIGGKFDRYTEPIHECIEAFLKFQTTPTIKNITKESILKTLMDNTHTECRYIGGGDEPVIIVFNHSDDQDKERFLSEIVDEILGHIN